MFVILAQLADFKAAESLVTAWIFMECKGNGRSL